MPYKSEAQRKKFEELAKDGKISPDKKAEWDAASHGLKLPERVAPKKQKTISTLKELKAIATKKR
jgi:hypothetical protein